MWSSSIKICLICIIGIHQLKEKFHRKTWKLKFWFKIKQQWTTEEFSIIRNNSHLEWRAGLSDNILKGTYPRTILARFGLIWFRGFRGDVDGQRTPIDGKKWLFIPLGNRRHPTESVNALNTWLCIQQQKPHQN